jgi:transcriptional regulator with XRE-family HTH domain
MTASEQFGYNLREHRLRLGLTQQELGDRCELHRTDICAFERARRAPTLPMIVRIARGLDVAPARLLDGI